MEVSDNIIALSNSSYALKPSTAQITKSHSSTRKRYQILQTLDMMSQTPKHRLISTPKISNNHTLNKELLRLEEMLDNEEIASSPTLEYENKDLKERDLKIYETYLDGMFRCTYQLDTRIGFCFSRGWNLYKKALHKGVKKQDLKGVQRFTVTSKEAGIQVTESYDDDTNQNEMNKYYEALNSLIKKIDTLNNEKLIKSLRELLKSLRKIDLPTLSLTPDEVPYTEYDRIVESTKAPNKVDQEKNEILIEKPKLSKLCLNRNTQTDLKVSDLNGLEYQRTMISQRDSVIRMQTSKMNTFVEIEALYKSQTEEFQQLKKLMDEFSNSECKHCKEKIEKLKVGTSEILKLKKSIVKQEKIETELETTKEKLKDVAIISNKKSEKIQELSENLEELTRKIDEVKIQRQLLESKLRDEEHLRAEAEKKLKQETVSHQILKQAFIEKASISNTPVSHSTIRRTPHGSISPVIEKKNTIIRKEIIRKGHFYDIEDQQSKNSENTPYSFSRELSGNFPDCITPVLKKITVTRNSHSTTRPEKHKINYDNKSDKKDTIEKILKTLKITREEFLQLPKNTRMELYESLYAHKEKCGTECEHLKRAMLIKSRHKNQYYPIKKYTIVKN